MSELTSLTQRGEQTSELYDLISLSLKQNDPQKQNSVQKYLDRALSRRIKNSSITNLQYGLPSGSKERLPFRENQSHVQLFSPQSQKDSHKKLYQTSVKKKQSSPP
jgi:hypothetical protein